MEGILYKWTNYISGWQPRWFVLEGGTLSYYDSQEDSWKGCKGSIKISVCEIQGWYLLTLYPDNIDAQYIFVLSHI
uniref:PH domain-containing protein n=1 Tax=Hucho hucho TaxID=62062 RepID=A0A4W5PC54_9TELE